MCIGFSNRYYCCMSIVLMCMLPLRRIKLYIAWDVCGWRADAVLKSMLRQHDTVASAFNYAAIGTFLHFSRAIHSIELDGKYSERVQLPAKAKFGGFCRQHLATLATPTIRSIKCKQSPVYGVFDSYFHIPLPIATKHELDFPFPVRTFP